MANGTGLRLGQATHERNRPRRPRYNGTRLHLEQATYERTRPRRPRYN
jgi:hypothetical protein